MFLEVKSHFKDWIKNRISDCDLIENVDYATFGKNLPQGCPSIEYALTLDAAKHISMIEQG